VVCGERASVPGLCAFRARRSEIHLKGMGKGERAVIQEIV